MTEQTAAQQALAAAETKYQQAQTRVAETAAEAAALRQAADSAAGARANLIDRAAEGEPIKPSELVAVDAEAQTARAAADLAEAIANAARHSQEVAQIALFTAQNAAHRENIEAATIARIAAAKAADDAHTVLTENLSDLDKAGEALHAARMAANAHDSQVGYAASREGNVTLAALHRGVWPIARQEAFIRPEKYTAVFELESQRRPRFSGQPVTHLAGGITEREAMALGRPIPAAGT